MPEHAEIKKGDNDDGSQKKRASISSFLSRNVGSANEEIQQLNDAKNEEIINSLDKENFYDKVLNNGAYDKARKEQERERKE